MRIGTYNVHGLSGWPVEAARAALGPAGGPRARAHFARVLAELDCDLLALQEGIAHEAMREVADALGVHLATFPSPERWPGHVLSRRPLADASALGGGGRRTQGGDAFSRSGGSVLVAGAGGDELGVVAVHLHPHDAAVRAREGELLCARARALLERTPAVVVLGDLNCAPGEPPHAELQALGFVHAPRAVLGRIPPTRPAVGEPRLAHDHAYLSPHLAKRLAGGRVVSGAGFHRDLPLAPGAWAHSDHLPLVVELADRATLSGRFTRGAEGPLRRLIPVLLLFWSSLVAGTPHALAASCEDERAVAGLLRGRDAEAMALLGSARAHGLDPGDYAGGALADSVLRLISDVHFGRLDASPYGHGAEPDERAGELGALAAAMLAAPSLEGALERVEPRVRQYRAVRAALERYRLLAAAAPSPPALPGSAVHPGEELVGAADLHRYLALLGDLPAGAAGADAGDRLDDGLVEAIRRFQERHGLAPDGVIGARTRAALAVPLARRVRQLELALERLRWLPAAPEGRWILVNIPAFRLVAFRAGSDDDAPALIMNVIVGDALDTRTPLLTAPMRYVEFRPYWNVPTSIAVKELLPALREDPTYLARQRMELVDAAGEVVPGAELTPERLAALGQPGGPRLRQVPGPRNALGLVKFGFPNEQAIYLHDTPSRGLFARERRDLSHGCIRVADPVALAELVLEGQGDAPWTRARIEEAMQGVEPLRVALGTPIPVVLFYSTAVVLPDGRVAFFEDVYGHDAELERALEAHQLRTRPVSRCTKSDDG